MSILFDLTKVCHQIKKKVLKQCCFTTVFKRYRMAQWYRQLNVPLPPHFLIICFGFTFPKAEAPAQMCVKLNCFWVAKMRGVSSSVKEGRIFHLNTSFLQSVRCSYPKLLAPYTSKFMKKNLSLPGNNPL